MLKAIPSEVNDMSIRSPLSNVPLQLPKSTPAPDRNPGRPLVRPLRRRPHSCNDDDEAAHHECPNDAFHHTSLLPPAVLMAARSTEIGAETATELSGEEMEKTAYNPPSHHASRRERE